MATPGAFLRRFGVKAPDIRGLDLLHSFSGDVPEPSAVLPELAGIKSTRAGNPRLFGQGLLFDLIFMT